MTEQGDVILHKLLFGITGMAEIKKAAKEVFLSCITIAGLLSALLAIELFPVDAGPLTVIVNPFSARSAMDVIAETQGSIASNGRWPWIAVAAESEDPSFKKKLREAGALFVMRSLGSTCLKDLVLQ